MHILQISKEYFPVLGGIETHLRDVSEALAERGHQVTVLVTSLDRHTRIEQPHPRLQIIKASRLLYVASTPLSLAMLHIARGLRPDIAHLHFPYPLADVAAMALPGSPPYVVTYHCDIQRQRTLLTAYRPLMERTLKRAARILPTSPNYLASSPILRRHAERCTVVPLGIDSGRFLHVEPRKLEEVRARYLPRRPSGSDALPFMLFVGRLRYYKGLHVMLDAMPNVRGELLIAGEGPERERLVSQAARLGVSERVHFLGDIPDEDLPALYQAVDVFVLPSHLRAEALGMSLIEALASGLPCVSTEIGTGTSFANLHGETGLVVPPSDAQALANGLNTLLADPDLRRRFGAAARLRVANLFSGPRTADSIEAIYRDVLNAQKR